MDKENPTCFGARGRHFGLCAFRSHDLQKRGSTHLRREGLRIKSRRREDAFSPANGTRVGKHIRPGETSVRTGDGGVEAAEDAHARGSAHPLGCL